MIVYKIKGDSEYIWPTLVEGDDIDVFVERGNSDVECRQKMIDAWTEIELVVDGEIKEFDRKDLYFPDAINVCSLVRGAEIIVSDRAKKSIAPYVEKECAFLPVNLKESQQKYWLLYVTKILDCLDLKKSKFGRYSPKSIRSHFFDSRCIEDTYLFRLPGQYDYLDDRDFATTRFLSLVRDLELEGFEFWECNKPGQDPIVTGLDNMPIQSFISKK